MQTKKKKKKKEREREKERNKVIESLGAIFLPHLERTFPLSEPLNRQWRERIEIIQVRKEHESFEKISKGSKKEWKLILVSWCNHVVVLLSG